MSRADELYAKHSKSQRALHEIENERAQREAEESARIAREATEQQRIAAEKAEREKNRKLPSVSQMQTTTSLDMADSALQIEQRNRENRVAEIMKQSQEQVQPKAEKQQKKKAVVESHNNKWEPEVKVDKPVTKEQAQAQYQKEYEREQNRIEAEKQLRDYEEIGREHPVLGTALSGATNLASVAGVAEIGRASISSDDVDPNSPYFAPQRITQALRSGAKENIDGKAGQVAYDIATTVGDMVLTKFATGPLGSLGYAGAMAAQAASSTAQDGAERGLSDSQIVAESIASAALTAVCEKIGFDKVFKPASATTAKGIIRNVVTGFAAEGSEEAVEEATNILFDYVVAQDQSNYNLAVEDFVNQGYSEDEAKIKALGQMASQVGQSFLMGGAAGGIISGFNSTVNYADNRFSGKDIDTPVSSDVNTPQNVQNSAPNPSVETQAKQFTDQPPNAIQGKNNDFVNELDDMEFDAEFNEADFEAEEYYDSRMYSQDIERQTAENDGFIFENDYAVEWQEVETLLNKLSSEKAHTVAQTMHENRAIASDPNVSYEQRVEAQSKVIKAEYDAAAYEGITGEKTEYPVITGNPGVDAAVNPRGVIRTVDAQAEKNIITLAQKKFGKAVRFVDTLNGSNGYMNKKTGEIVIARDAEGKLTTVFGHEYTHTLEGTKEYIDLLRHIKNNSATVKNKIEQSGVGDWNGLIKQIQAEYAAAGITLSDADAEMEIVAQTIGEEFFSNENTLTSLATQNRSLFQRFKQWFERNLYKTVRGGIHKEMSAEKAAKQTYRLLLRAQQAANKNTATQGDGEKFAIMRTTKNEPVVVIEEKILDGIPENKWISAVREALFNKFSKGIEFKGKTFKVNQRSRRELTFSKESQNLLRFAKETYQDKLNSLNNLDEIVQASTNYVNEELHHSRNDSIRDFSRGKVLIQIGENKYTAEVLIGNTVNDELVLYDVVSLAKTDFEVQNNKKSSVKFASRLLQSEQQEPVAVTPDNNSISNSPYNVKHSAKKSDIVADLVSTYNYTQETANKVFVNAYNLKKKTGSKADIQEVSAVIANALEKRRNGDFGESDITAVADLIASGSKTENETVISEAKPILNYLKGIKITLSDTDISDLGESFSNARGKLFPYLTLAKQGGISVDSLYQDLSTRFPESFNAVEVTHPADQVNSIIGFLDYYRTHRYVGAFEDSEAYEALRNDIRTMFSTASDAKSFVGQLSALCEKYGELKNGVPKSTDGTTKVRRTAASIYGGEAVQNNLALAEKFGEKIVQGHFNYEVQLQGKQAEAYIERIKNAPDVVKAFEAEYSNCRNAIIGLGANPTADEVLKASALLPMAAEYLNEHDFIEYATSLAEVGTQAGRAVSALRYVAKFSGAQQLIAVQRKVDDYNRKIEDKFLKGQGKFGENGQVEETEWTSGNKGVDIAVKTRKGKTFTPVDIDKSLQEELVKARGAEEIERIMKKVTDDIASQIDYSWWDKLNAFRYFAMLSNPRTWIRNSVGNAVMIGSSRVKDVVGVGIDKIVGGKGYDTDNPQTRSIIISKDAKAAAQNLITNDNTIERLFSGQEKYTGKSGIQNMQRQNALSSTPVLRNLVKIQEKGIDDQPFRIFRAKSVLAQAIEANLKNGNIESLEDFQTVALNGNNEHLSNEIRLKYRRMYDRFCEIAAREGDEATFREENKLINKINKFKQGNTAWEKGVAVLSEGAMPFLKTPANIVKRGAEYSPLGLGKTLVADSVKLHSGTIDVNQYVNNLAKGLTGSAVWGLGMALGALGALSAGDDDEEDTAKRKLENGQEYAVNVGNYSFTIDWLTPASLSLFMGVKTSEMIQQARDGVWEWADLLGLASTALDVAQSITEPMFNLTMLDGLDGAFRAIQSGSYEGGTNAQVMALLEYCAESYISQFFPSVIASVARTTDDTVRTYYTDKGDKIPDELESFGTTITKKIPSLANQNAALLDIWGQPKSSGNVVERAAENFVSPGYFEKKNSTAEIRAMFKFAEENKIAYTDILPVKPDTEYKKPDKSTVYWTRDEYEQLASAVGQAQKDAVQKYLVEGQPVSVEYTLPMLDSSLKSGKRTLKVTYTGDIRKAQNTARWAPTSSIKYDENGKPTSITAASDEDFRAMLYEKLMESVVEQAEAQAIDKLLKNKE